MIKYLLIVSIFFITDLSFSQSTPHFEKVVIGNSGAQVYFPAKPGVIDMSYSEDSSQVYTFGCSFDGFDFDVIFVKLGQAVESKDVEPLLTSYLDYLKTAAKVSSAAGYGKGHTLGTHASAVGVLDYWKDQDKNELAIMGWADKNYIAVLSVTGKAQYPNPSVVDVFFKGIRFPGD